MRTTSRSMSVSSRPARLAAGVVFAGLLAGCASGGQTSTPDTLRSDTVATDAPETSEGPTATDASADTLPGGVTPGWLVLVYEATDNDLESAVLTDMLEMGVVAADLDVVVMLDRSDDDDPSGGYSNDDSYPGIPEALGASQLLHAGDGGLEQIGSIPEVNTGDPAYLSAFIAGAIELYPREHVAIIIGDHGAAWRGVAQDETSGDILSLVEMSSAFESALDTSGRESFDVIGFDACLMASLEVAAAVAPYGRYMVASEEVEPGDGWDWTVLNEVAGTNPEQFAVVLADGYTEYYADESQISTQTMSVTDLSQVDELQSALASLVAVTGIDAAASAVTIARSASRAYGFADSPDPAQAYHQLDIGDLIETLAKEDPSLAGDADAVLAALDAAVVSNSFGTLSDQASGLSIYLPPNASLAKESYLDLDGMNAWQGLLASYLTVTNDVSVPAAFDDEDKYIDGTWTSGGFQIAADYDAAAEATVIDARLRYGTYSGDFASMIFYGSDPLEFGDGHVGGVFEPQVMQITDGAISSYAYATFEVAGDRSRAVASIPLEYEAPDGQLERVDLRMVFDQAGALLSKDFVLFGTFGVGRASVDPAGRMFPIAAVQSLETFEEVWERTAGEGLSADIALIDGGFVPIPETTALVAQLELHALDGSVDFLFAGDAVPFGFYDERGSYPNPS